MSTRNVENVCEKNDSGGVGKSLSACSYLCGAGLVEDDVVRKS